MLQALRFRVTGKVQGVFFRKYTKEEADRLHLTGFVKNMADGSVTGVAEGPADKLDLFCAWLKKGSPKSRVDGVEVSERKGVPSAAHQSFEVDRTPDKKPTKSK
eukprot:m.268560 g.268560  ORF g.268560 m.268560 type:complete len:104 (-) comp35011_c0_seq1:136-447(-)